MPRHVRSVCTASGSRIVHPDRCRHQSGKQRWSFGECKGELVGINAVLSSPTGAYAGYGFAIPTSVMTKVVSDLKQYGTVQRALLGIKGTSLAGDGDMMSDQPIDKSGATLSDKRKEFGVVDGVWVREIVDGGSAAGSDIKVDDVIIGIDGRKCRTLPTCRKPLHSIVRAIK